ncbi:hypothetical protein Tco_0597469 [Tanacetum coccineum]
MVMIWMVTTGGVVTAARWWGDMRRWWVVRRARGGEWYSGSYRSDDKEKIWDLAGKTNRKTFPTTADDGRRKMELENSQNNSLAKLPILKLGEYEMWEIRIKQYFQIQDYALWEVIENGNSWVPIPVTAPDSGPSTALKLTVPSTN